MADAESTWLESQPDDWRESLSTTDGVVDEPRLTLLKSVDNLPALVDKFVVAPSDGDKPWLESQPDNWRELLTTKDDTRDDARFNHLQRVSGLPALIDNYFEAQDKIRSGQIEAVKPPDEHSTDEEWATYRTENSIPATAEEYEVTLDEGLILGDEDKEILSKVFPVAHALNLPSAAVSLLSNAMLDAQQQQFHALEIQQEKFKSEATAQIHAAWKGDYEVNINLLKSTILGSLPEAVREEFEHATLADGRKVFNSPEMLIAMADWARQMNPSATVVPNSANPMQAIETEIEGYEKQMSEDSVAWHKDNDAQTRYMQLIEARDNLRNQ